MAFEKVPDLMLDHDETRLFNELRLSKEANLNMVRIWGGGVTPPEEFFRICDQLGLLVWHDFWITGDCQGTWDKGSQDYPFEEDVFLNNASDVVRKLRNHPSLIVWTGGNEGYAREEIYVPLRNEIVARLVSYSVEEGKTFAQLSLSEFKKFSQLFGEDVSSVTVESSLAARDVIGGTAPGQVEKALAAARKSVAKNEG